MLVRNEPMSPIERRHKRTKPFSSKGILRNPRLAAEAEHSEVVKFLLARPDVNINAEYVYGDMLLHRATRRRRPAILRMPLLRQKPKLIQGPITEVFLSYSQQELDILTL